MIICVAGKNEIAVKALEYLLHHHPDKRVVSLTNKNDQGVDAWQPSYRKYALEHCVEILSLDDLYGISDLLFISLEYDRMINTKKFSTRRLYNIHFSLLPKYKGMYTSAWPILNGDSESGVTLHEIDDGIDTGNIIDQISFPIKCDETARDLYFNYLKYAYVVFSRNIESLISGVTVSKLQPNINSSYYSKSSIDYKNLKIDLNKTAFEIHNQLRAFTFKEFQLPQVYGKTIVKSVILAAKCGCKPGTVISESSDCIKLATVDYDLCLYFI